MCPSFALSNGLLICYLQRRNMGSKERNGIAVIAAARLIVSR